MKPAGLFLLLSLALYLAWPFIEPAYARIFGAGLVRSLRTLGYEATAAVDGRSLEVWIRLPSGTRFVSPTGAELNGLLLNVITLLALFGATSERRHPRTWIGLAGALSLLLLYQIAFGSHLVLLAARPAGTGEDPWLPFLTSGGMLVPLLLWCGLHPRVRRNVAPGSGALRRRVQGSR